MKLSRTGATPTNRRSALEALWAHDERVQEAIDELATLLPEPPFWDERSPVGEYLIELLAREW